MSNKLTNGLRDKIVENAWTQLFQKELEDIKQVQMQLADQIYEKYIATPAQQEIMKILPAEFFAANDYIYCYINNRQIGNSVTLRFSTARRLPSFVCGCYPEFNDADLDTVWNKLTAEKNSILRERDKLCKEIRGVVNSVTTVSKLLEVWPESKKFIPDHAFTKAGIPNLPAVMIDNLNAALVSAGVQFAENA
jgi:hypothetical protein